MVTDDARWMQRALIHARRGLGRTTPNPVVGACVVTADQVVVGDGAHQRAGEPHAEVHALRQAGDRARGATLYCTLEPCAHTGRTGPCTDRIIDAGIRRVVAAMEDPFPLVRGRGFERLRARGIEVTVGVGREAAARLNQPFTTSIVRERPFVILKAAASADGWIAARPGERTAITAGAALRHAQLVRAWVDAVAVGSDTVLIDDPWLTVREVYRARPLARVVFDRRLRTPPTARLLSTLDAGPVIILTSAEAVRQAPERARALDAAGAVLIAREHSTVLEGLRALAGFEIQSLVLEGGARLHRAAWDEGVVDQVQLYLSPSVLGPGGVPLLGGEPFDVSALRELSVRPLGPDVLFEGYVHRPD